METQEATPEVTGSAVEPAGETTEATPEAGKGPPVRECLFGEGVPLHDLVGNVHAEAAMTTVVVGIAQGYPDGTFRPDVAVSRGQMASFLAPRARARRRPCRRARQRPGTPCTPPRSWPWWKRGGGDSLTCEIPQAAVEVVAEAARLMPTPTTAGPS